MRARVPVAVAGLVAGLVAGPALGSLGGPAAQTSERARESPDTAVVIPNGTARVRTLHEGERDFAVLRTLLNPEYRSTERVPGAWEEGRFPQVRATVLWTLSGVGGWPATDAPPGSEMVVRRQDQVFLDEDDVPWVRSDPSVDVNDDDIRWHRAPLEPFGRAERAGLLGPGEGSAGAGAKEEREGTADVRWALPGLAVGFAAGVGGTPLIRRAAGRQGAGPPRGEPRQELIDL